MENENRPLTDAEMTALAAVAMCDAAATMNDAAHAQALGERPICEHQSAAQGRLVAELRRRGLL